MVLIQEENRFRQGTNPFVFHHVMKALDSRIHPPFRGPLSPAFRWAAAARSVGRTESSKRSVTLRTEPRVPWRRCRTVVVPFVGDEGSACFWGSVNQHVSVSAKEALDASYLIFCPSLKYWFTNQQFSDTWSIKVNEVTRS